MQLLFVIAAQLLLAQVATLERTNRYTKPIESRRLSFPSHFKRSTPHRTKTKSSGSGVPPYAVQMEPLVQYSQPDPLYTIEKQYLSEAKISDGPANELQIKTAELKESISRIGTAPHVTHGRFRKPQQPHGVPLRPPPPQPHHHQQQHHHHHQQQHHPEDVLADPSSQVEFSSYGTYYEGPALPEDPEPIIEIIIKESNESLPTPPPIPAPPRKPQKEPVQVYYVKYKKEEGYGGEEKVIYDPPVPAITPPTNDDEEESYHQKEAEKEAEYHESVTVPPLPPTPSTTLKAIIRPDSETFQSSGVHITFGEPHEHEHGEYQQSAPQPAVVHPNSQLTKRNPPPFHEPQQQQQQSQPQFFRQPPSPSPPPIYQQIPQFPPADFQPPPQGLHPYSTLPQHLRYQTINPQFQAFNNQLPPNNMPPVSFNPQHSLQSPQSPQSLQSPHSVTSQRFSSSTLPPPTQQNLFTPRPPQPQTPVSAQKPFLNFHRGSQPDAPLPSHLHFRSSSSATPQQYTTPLAMTEARFATRKASIISSTTAATTPEIVTEDPKKLEEERLKKQQREKENVASLPDEVPEDLRRELLSSGILSNADIQILDYDKIGDIPIESLPPEALANFQQATAGSRRIAVVRKPDDSAEDLIDEDQDTDSKATELRPVTVEPMEMKVVRFNPKDDFVADKYLMSNATKTAPVVLNDQKYNRYLPLKVSGTQFPVPDIPELRGRNITSVVVLAPVDYQFLNRRDSETPRETRDAAPVLEVQGVQFVSGDSLKSLVKTPTAENYRKWLEKENSTSPEKQSVVLLVLEPNGKHDKEIYMYDISSQKVTKLRGDLSSTFVQVAESNSQSRDLESFSENSDFNIFPRSQPITTN